MVDKQHWLDRWDQDRIGFHDSSVNQHLQASLADFKLNQGARIFLPLCGKSVDIVWLTGLGFEVIGVEFSKIAIEAFFDQQAIPYELHRGARFVTYRADNITLLQGDFFDLRHDDLSECALVYDRAALIALEATDRPRYYRHMLSLLPAACEMLLITLEYDQTEMRGPPFATLNEEVSQFYQEVFSIDVLHRLSVIDERPRWRDVGLTSLVEVVCRLRRRP